MLLYIYQRHCMSTKVILKKVKVKARSQKVTKNKSQVCRATHVFWVILHVDIDSDGHLTRSSDEHALTHIARGRGRI